MKHLPLIAFLALALACLPVLPAQAQQDRTAEATDVDLEKAKAAADRWLALVDADEFGASWDAGGEEMHKGVTREDWTRLLRDVRQQIGALQSRMFDKSGPVRDPEGAPPGLYAIVLYKSVFQKAAMSEELVLIMEPDGQLRVVGYWLR